MLKILKHIFNSFLKNKVIFIGLTTLIFFTTGIFTLLFTTNSSYTNRLQEYKQVSKLQDATINTNFNYFGNAVDNGYDKLEADVYKSQNIANNKKQLLISSDFIKIADISNTQNDDNQYLSTLDFSREYYLNLGNLPVLSQFSVQKQTFLPIYNKVGNQFVKSTKSFNLQQNETITLDSTNYKLSDVILFHKEDNTIKIDFINDLVINGVTKKATFDPILGSLWFRQGVGYKLPQQKLLKLFGLTNNNGSLTLDSTTTNNSEKIATIVLNPVNQTIEFSKTTFNLDNDLSWNSSNFFILDPGQQYNLKPEWISDINTKIEYINHKFQLKSLDAPQNTNFSGFIKQYLEYLRDRKPLEFEKIKNINYWEKRIITTIDNKSETTSTKITTSDLTTPLLQEKVNSSTPTTIAQIENLGNQNNINLITVEQLEDISNSNIRDATFLKISTDVRKFANAFLYDYLGKYQQNINGKTTKVVDALGTREFITIDLSNPDEKQVDKKNQVIQFINSGISPSDFDTLEFDGRKISQKQQVGRLYDETLKYQKGQKSLLFSDNDPVINEVTSQIPPRYTAQIISQIFSGYATDPNYVDLKVIFDNYIVRDPKTVGLDTKLAQKIVLLSKEDQSDGKEYGVISLGANIFGIVTKIDNQNWEYNTINTYNSINELTDFLEANQLELKANIGANGWLRSIQDFNNTKTVPFIFYAPSTDVLNEINNQKSIKLLFSQAASAINNSVLVTQGFLLKPDVDALAKAFSKAADELELVAILSGSKKNYDILNQWIFKSLYYLTSDNRATIVNDILANLVDKIIEKSSHISNQQDRSVFIIEQIFAIKPFLRVFGINALDKFDEFLSAKDLARAIKDPVAILNGIKDLAYSIEFEKVFKNIDNWFKNHSQKDNKIHLFSSAILFQEISANINEQIFKSGLIKIINNINFEAILSTKTKANGKGFLGFLIQPILDKYAKEKHNEIITILKKLQADDSKPFSNIADGLVNLVANFDFKIFATNLEKVFATATTSDNSNPEKILTFEKQTIDNNRLFVALLATLFRDERSRQNTINQVIKILNISDKSTNIGSNLVGINYIQPAKDDSKIDIFDLQSLSATKGNANLVDNIESALASLKTKLNQSNPENNISNTFSLNATERSFLVNFLNVKSFTDSADLLAKINEFEKVFNLFKLANFSKTGSFISNILNLDNAAFANLNSIGDVFYQLTNSLVYDDGERGNLNDFSQDEKNKLFVIYRLASQDLTNSLQQKIFQSPLSNISYSISLFRFWIDFVAQNDLSAADLKQAFKILYDSASDANSQLFKALNSTELFGQANIAQQEGLIKGLPSPSRSILFPKQTTNELLKNGQLDRLLSAPIFDKVYKNKDNKNISLRQWLLDNRVDLVENLGYIAYYNKNYPFAINYAKALPIVVNDYLLDSNKINQKNKAYLQQLSYHFAAPNPLLKALNLEFLGLSEFISSQLPQIPLWFASNAQQKQGSNNSNLAFILQNRLPLSKEIIDQQQNNSLQQFVANLSADNSSLKVAAAPSLNLDYYFINSFTEKNFANSLNSSFFGIDIPSLARDILSNVLVVRSFFNLVNFNDNRAYVIKLNDSFIRANNKAIYNGPIPQTSEEIEALISKLDERFILNANGLKYIIVGKDFTVDYLYPVLDEKNLQLDPTNQALGFVNKWGFDKVRYSFRSNPIKSYLLVKLVPGANLEDFKKDTDKFINTNFAQANSQKTFAVDEFDFINPERSLRVSVGSTIINSFSSTNIYLTIFLSILAIFAVSFITKRYISNNNKVLGILRAQGYSLFEIASSFIAISFFIAFIGGILGYISGFFLRIPIINLISRFWEFDVSYTSFEPISFVASIIAPFVILTLLIYAIIFWILRQKPHQLLSGISEINTSKTAQKIAKVFWKRSITSKFSISLALNSAWKLVSLAVSIILVQFILIFSLASQNIFTTAIDKTYQHRKYNYKVNLYTPTAEGGPIVPYDPKNLVNNLYVPSGDPAEVDQVTYNYFKPGEALVFGSKNQNGKRIANNPIVITRSSLNIKTVANTATTIFDIVLGQLPESLKNNIFSISDKVVSQLEASQNIQTVKINGQDFSFRGEAPNYLPYFKFIKDADAPQQGRFWYFSYDKQKQAYQASEVSLFGNNRDAYRQFLVDSYASPQVNKDFTISFGGIQFDRNQDEIYSYIETNYQGKTSKEAGLKIYGYQPNSKLVKISDASGNNLLAKIANLKLAPNVYPLIANNVFLQKHNLDIGSQIELPILNKTNRFLNVIENKTSENITFEIVGISNTFINSELSTTQDVVNKLIGLDAFEQDLAAFGLKPFNGILIAGQDLEQLSSSFGLYSPSGYWAGHPDINPTQITSDDAAGFFASIFAFDSDATHQGLLQRQGLALEKIYQVINWSQRDNPSNWSIKDGVDLSYSNLTSSAFIRQNIGAIREALKNFNSIYGNNSLYQIETQGVEARNIETNFISNFGFLFGTGINLVVIIFLIVSVIILLIISSSIINENEKNIAILGILGYSNWSKIKLFFSIYLPLVIFASILAIPIVVAIMSIFNSAILSVNSIFLALSLTWPIFFISLAIILIVFSATLGLSWYILNRKRAISVLKEKD
ncbi:ABC transporter permease [Mesomycoplasma conjunctivae]|uniref:ABC transporter permease n=1 Tax=Mesomycoplasma conjunctivae TaxID=45361 RepID=UPI003DA225D1